jgi:RHS repeat-associated protein
VLKDSSNATLTSQSYTYADNDNVLTHTKGGVTTTYGYDDIDQLTSESRSGYSATYSYDANGNRLTRTVGGVTEDYVVDDADKLTEVKVGGTPVKTYGYDAAGRTTSVVSGAGTTTLAYDYEGRISQITYPSTATNTFAYNGLDTRVSKVDSSGTSTFLRDGAYVTDPVLSDSSAGYTPGISERRGSTSTFVHGGLKNLDAQTSSSEVVTAERVYDAFGNVVGSSGTWNGPFGYAGGFGYQEDADSGLKLLGHRYYDPSTGRFLTRDPAKDGRNWYGYGGGRNSPVSLTDPDGRTPKLLLAIPIVMGIWDIYDFIRDPSLVNGIGLLPGPHKVGKWGQRIGKGMRKLFPEEVLKVDNKKPNGWIQSPADQGGGTKFRDPGNKDNSIRLDPPDAHNPTHVHVNHGGKAVGIGGVDASNLPGDHPTRHIPLDHWLNWEHWFKP